MTSGSSKKADFTTSPFIASHFVLYSRDAVWLQSSDYTDLTSLLHVVTGAKADSTAYRVHNILDSSLKPFAGNRLNGFPKKSKILNY